MTTWDVDTIQRVRRLGARMTADPIVLATHPGDVPEYLRRKAARHIVETARALAVEVHPDDVAAVVLEKGEHEPEYAPVRFAMHWRPGWRDAGVEVELRGGYRDGDTMMVRHDQLDHGIVLPTAPLPPMAAYFDERAPYMPLPMPVRYQLAGWREDERRWVMAREEQR